MRIILTVGREKEISSNTHSKPVSLSAEELSTVRLGTSVASMSLISDVRMSIADELKYRPVEQTMSIFLYLSVIC